MNTTKTINRARNRRIERNEGRESIGGVMTGEYLRISTDDVMGGYKPKRLV